MHIKGTMSGNPLACTGRGLDRSRRTGICAVAPELRDRNLLGLGRNRELNNQLTVLAPRHPKYPTAAATIPAIPVPTITTAPTIPNRPNHLSHAGAPTPSTSRGSNLAQAPRRRCLFSLFTLPQHDSRCHQWRLSVAHPTPQVAQYRPNTDRRTSYDKFCWVFFF